MHFVNKHNRVGLMTRLFGLLALAAALLLGSVEGRAELDPYYFLRGRTFSKITPRILFVVDVSGSMTWKIGPSTYYVQCSWPECEGDDPVKMSRVKGARDAINTVVEQTSDLADFAFMTFDMMQPPTTKPSKCNGQKYWFYWMNEYTNPSEYGWFPSQYITNQFGTTGMWTLCEYDYNVPYAYLRWDDIGFEDPSIEQDTAKTDETIPPGPLFSPGGLGTQAEYTNTTANSPMRWRKVEWFPEFMGPRFHVDCSENKFDSLAKRAVGDYSYASGEICGHDFYYWPYVDGFPGYSRADMWGSSNPYCTSESTTCPQPKVPGFDTCMDTDGAGHDCKYPDPGGTPTYQSCSSSCLRWSNTFGQYLHGGHCPTLVWYYGYFSGSEEACCQWFQDVNPGLTCFNYGVPYFWGSTCGSNESCCETVASQAGLSLDACKSYDMVCPVEEIVDHCATYSTFGWEEWAGTHDRGWTYSGSAALLAPFYFQEAVDTWAGNANPTEALKAGPLSEKEANDRVFWLSSDMMHGGIDVDHDTPWSYNIGSSTVTPPNSNAPFSHGTVASYLKYVTTTGETDSCKPTYAVLISDGIPSYCSYPCTTLSNDLAALRNTLGVKTYVVGFGLNEGGIIDHMACAAAGSASGCAGTPADNWDTCKTVGTSSGCAFLADDPQQLSDALVSIVNGALDIDVPSGPGTAMNSMGVGAASDEISQTKVTAYTEYPGWKGHVRQDLCGDEDPATPGELAEHCSALPFTKDEETHATFGPCARHTDMQPAFGDADSLKVWDAGDCLAQTAWTDRRIYSHDSNKQLFRITAAGNPYAASPEFKTELNSVLGTTLTDAQANAVARFIMGEGWPDGWKLPGLAMSAPVVVRRVPEPDTTFVPSLGIRDPHCAGRVLANAGDVPQSLLDFAKDAWTTKSDVYGTYHEYQEAVIVGDDLGVLHAFQLATGNELFGLIPRFALKAAYEESQIGAAARGQPQELAEHKYGVSATINQGWVWDDAGTPDVYGDDSWHHLVVLGMGVGGTEFIALDVSHMGRLASNRPVDVLWTTEDPGLKPTYDPYMGETWARPALTYRFDDPENDDLAVPPRAYVLMGSGYQTLDPPNPSSEQGRRLWLADALTGQVEQYARIPAIDPSKSWDENYGTLTDAAVGTHCISGYWAEMQEAYIADPYGRLFRWDLFYPSGDPDEGQSDSENNWSSNSHWATQVEAFGSCKGAGTSCSVVASPHDPFFYGPAVVANNRIDPPTGNVTGWDSSKEDQFMIGLISGNMNDDATNAYGNEFHSSIYLLVDDHRVDKHEGFTIPWGAPKRAPGTEPYYMRLALSDIDRTRTIHYPDGTSDITTAKFKQGTRPLRAPRMNVFGVVDQNGTMLDDIEVIYISFYVFEPGEQTCDPHWKDPVSGLWTFDSGSSYEISFRVTVDDTEGFNLITGSGQTYFDDVLFGDSGGGAGLIGPEVTQVGTDDCESGACGPRIPLAPNLPCDPNEGAVAESGRITVPVAWSEVTGFTPVE